MKAARPGTPAALRPGKLSASAQGSPATAMATRPSGQASRDSSPGPDSCATRDRRATLPADPRAVAEARRQVRAAVRNWRLPADIDVAALLASELVTNAITHSGRASGDRDAITLALSCSEGRLRVDVHDRSPEPPAMSDSVPAGAQGGRGLFLVDSLAAAWGSYRTAAGKAVYFTL